MSTGAGLPERSAGGGIPLRLRPDLQISAVRTIHGQGWLLRDPLRLSYFEVSPAGLRYLQLLNGWRSLSDLLQALQTEFPDDVISADDLQILQRDALQAGLLQTIWPRRSLLSAASDRSPQADTQTGPQAIASTDSLTTARRLLSRWGLSRLSFRWRGPDPTPLLDWLVPRLQRFRHPLLKPALLSFVLMAFVAVLLSARQLQAELPDLSALLTVTNLLALGTAITIARILHELGHAVACRWYGGECHELGITMILCFPLLYCDVSDSRRFPTTQRIVVAAAGILVELLIAAVAACLWLLSYPGFLHALFLNLLLFCSLNTLLINGNPLLRYDGYYVLSDLLAIPNLWQQAVRSAGRAVGRLVLGPLRATGDELPVSALASTGLSILGVAMALWRLSATLTLLLIVYRLLEPVGLESAVVFPASASVLLGIPAMYSGLQQRLSEAVNPRRAQVRLWASLSVCLLLCCVPFSWPVSVPCLLTPGTAAAVYVRSGGVLEWSVAAGATVQVGDVLARFRNAELEQQLAAAEGAQSLRQATVRTLQNRQFTEPAAAAALPAAEQSLKAAIDRCQTLRTMVADLTLCSPRAGIVMLPRNLPTASNPDASLQGWTRFVLDTTTRGGWVEPQTLICWVGEPNDLRIMAVAEQSDVERVRADIDAARVTLFSRTDWRLVATVTEVGTSPLEVVDRELISSGLVSARADGSPAQPLFPAELSAGHLFQQQVERGEVLPPLYSVGMARLPTQQASLLHRTWRLARRTFRLPALP